MAWSTCQPVTRCGRTTEPIDTIDSSEKDLALECVCCRIGNIGDWFFRAEVD